MSRKVVLQERRTNSSFGTNEEKTYPVHFINQRKELLADLMNMGFEESEAIMYLGLLHIGPITVGNLAIKLGLDRGKMYRSLTKLRNYGLVTTSFSNPVIVTPTEPGKALETIIEKKRDELHSMKKLSQKVITNLKIYKTEIKEESDISTFSVLQSRPIIYNRIGRIFDDSKNNLIYIVTTTNDIAKMYYTSMPEKILNAKKNNVTIRVITEDKPTKVISEMIKRLNASEVRVGVLPSKGRMIVEKEKQIVMSESSEDSTDAGNSDVAIHTNSLEIVQNMYSLCEYLWNNSKEFVEI